MATIGTVKVQDLSRYKLHQRYVSSITDADAVTTGIKGIAKVMTRCGTGAPANVPLEVSSASNTLSYSAGSASSLRRTSARLTNAATGEVTIDTASGASSVILMIWALS